MTDKNIDQQGDVIDAVGNLFGAVKRKIAAAKAKAFPDLTEAQRDAKIADSIQARKDLGRTISRAGYRTGQTLIATPVTAVVKGTSGFVSGALGLRKRGEKEEAKAEAGPSRFAQGGSDNHENQDEGLGN